MELAFRRMFGLFAGIGASLVLKVRVLKYLGLPCPIVWVWNLGAHSSADLEAVCTTPPSPTSDGRLSVAQAHQQ